jgi:hypothetical protein
VGFGGLMTNNFCVESFVVHVIEKGNTNGVLEFYMAFDEEKWESHKDSLGLRSFYFICVVGAPYYQGGCIE